MLEGIRIVEFEGLGPAPFAAMMLADLGAEVTTVHRPTPPYPNAPERNPLDRGKQSIVLDLKDVDDLEVARKLALDADGIIEAFRPGVMERLGLGPARLLAEHPALVYGRLTGWGQNGPRAATAGHDLNYLAVSGALWFSTPDCPSVPPTLLGDVGGGALYLVAGMLAALLRASRTGRGAVIDAAIVDGAAHMMNLLLSAQSANMIGQERGASVLDGAPWSRCYRTADSAWLSVQCLEPQFYDALLYGLGVSGNANFERQMDPITWPALAKRLEECFASKTLDAWCETFADSDACVAPVLSPWQAATEPHMAARRSWITAGSGLQAAPAPRFDDEPPNDPEGPPRRGQHTAEILRRVQGG